MKKLIPFLILLLISFSAAARGQNTVSLTSGGFIVVSGENPGTPLSTQSPAGQPVTAQINFGDASPSLFGSRRIVVKMPIRISATVDYKIEFQRLSVNDGSVKPSDIGFGIINLRAQIPGSNELKNNATNVNGGNFLNNPTSSPVINGKPHFTTTLENISESPTLVLSGVPTVNSDSTNDLAKDETSILADLIFVLPAQYFNPEKPFSLKLNMSISPQ